MARVEPRPPVVPEEPVVEHVPPAEEDTFRPSTRGWMARGGVLALILSVPLLVPLFRPDFELLLFSKAVVYAIIGLSLNVLIGYTGQISLGHQAFVGIGAFASGYIVSEQQLPFAVALLVAMGVGAVQALVLGGVSLRIRGLYFALVTLAYGLLAEDSLFKIERFTGGGAGQTAPRPAGFESNHRYYYLALLCLGAVLWVDWRLMRTKGGRALLALRENPRVAATFGIDVKMFTLLAFVVSGVFAGLGGALFAHNDGQVSAVSFNFRLALVFILMTVVGGLRSRSGVVIGSAFFALLGFIIEHIPGLESALHAIPLVPDLSPEVAELVVGPVLLLLTITQFPGGIGQQIRPITQWLAGKRFNIHDRGAAEVVITDVRA